MKKTLLSVAVVVALASATSVFAAEGGTGYVGVKGGWSHLNTHSGRLSEGVAIDDRDAISYGLYGGYNLSDFFGLEIGYSNYGRFSAKGPRHGNDDLIIHGADASAIVAFPFNKTDDLFLKLGVLYATTRDEIYDVSHSSASPLLGVGTRFAFSDSFQARVEYNYAHTVTKQDAFGYAPDLHNVSLGLEWKFGGAEEPAPVVAPAPAPKPEPVVVKKQISLDANALFGFNKNQLSEQGNQEIKRVSKEIESANLKDVQINVVGHTDRIGSDQYNNKLSQQRAQAVVDALVDNGVNSRNITAEGRGKTEPVTGSKCDNIKNRKKLIECLAPDRRVEVNFRGITEYVEQQ